MAISTEDHLKHYLGLANDQETKRFHSNAIIPDRALREVYLAPFQTVVREADPWCMMTAYNKVNGYHVDMSRQLLHDIARMEWAWEGVFISDWGGTNSCIDSINAGLDLEMPGPPLQRTPEAMADAIESGKIDREQLHRSARRTLRLLQRCRRFEDANDGPEYCDDTPEKREKLRRAAAAGIVLLKNDNKILPLKIQQLQNVAVVGPNAERVIAGGGGSSYIKAPYWTSVLTSVQERMEKGSTNVHFHVGARINRYLPTLSLQHARAPVQEKAGASIEWYNQHSFAESSFVASTHIEDLYFISFNDAPKAIDPAASFAFRLRTILTPKTSGPHKISLASIGPAKLYINGELTLEQSGAFGEKGSMFFTYGSEEKIKTHKFVAGYDYNITVECLSHDRHLQPELDGCLDPMETNFQGVRLGYEEIDDSDLPSAAAKMASDNGCDTAIVVVGRDKEWETEGQDIPLFELPGEQTRLIELMRSVCKKVIVVVQAGTPVQMLPWLDRVDAVLYCWYQGQELGNAAADVLFGNFNPSGRLPITFPRRLEDCPAYSSFPGEQLSSYYSEGIHVGYRWWDLMGTQPLFPIGFGLSYSSFDVEDSKLSHSVWPQDGNSLVLSATVRNVSEDIALAGRETVLVWFWQISKPRLVRPVRQICGFIKTPLLGPGKACKINVNIDAYGLAVWDAERTAWVIDSGSRFEIATSTSKLGLRSVGQIKVEQEVCYVHKLGDMG
ncbi:hypothetical protein SLS60_004337 [Paraconiothyrium brasiliense]|uniref:beta-glucosidase n=1 Tax=Paraconiothyrium brasiliense TaxID=300254 RepID=A0ABR3RLN8_9PLEO